MQDGGGDAFAVEVHVRENAGDFDRMINVRFAGGAQLPLMGLGAEQIGAIDVGDVLGLEVGFQKRAQVGNLKPLPVRRRGGRRYRLRLRFRPLWRRLG